MILYVDGNDLAEALRRSEQKASSRPAGRPSRREVARWLACCAQGWEVVLVFDESPPHPPLPPVERQGPVRMLNLEPGARAMHEIAGQANRAAESSRVLVVTDDPALSSALSRGKARVLGAEEFLERTRKGLRGDEDRHLEEPDEKYSGLADPDVRYWLKVFGDGQ